MDRIFWVMSVSIFATSSDSQKSFQTWLLAIRSQKFLRSMSMSLLALGCRRRRRLGASGRGTTTGSRPRRHSGTTRRLTLEGLVLGGKLLDLCHELIDLLLGRCRGLDVSDLRCDPGDVV